MLSVVLVGEDPNHNPYPAWDNHNMQPAHLAMLALKNRGLVIGSSAMFAFVLIAFCIWNGVVTTEVVGKVVVATVVVGRVVVATVVGYHAHGQHTTTTTSPNNLSWATTTTNSPSNLL